jgi:hypothetical protein
MRKDPSPHTPNAPIRAALHLAAGIFLLAAGAVFAAPVLAQTPAAQTTSPSLGSTARPVHRHKRPSPPPAVVATDPVVPAPLAPPAPQPPSWPAFDRAAEASVVWDSHGLSIDAANSSLEQILKDVSTATGAKVEGLSADQRVFGVFGPGPAREVLSQVLQGSGYNVIMIGGQSAPRQIFLSERQAGPAQPAARNNTPSNDEDETAEEPQQPSGPEATPSRPGFPPGFPPGVGGPPRSPQLIMQEMQQRQQFQQQQQQQPQQTPQN